MLINMTHTKISVETTYEWRLCRVDDRGYWACECDADGNVEPGDYNTALSLVAAGTHEAFTRVIPTAIDRVKHTYGHGTCQFCARTVKLARLESECVCGATYNQAGQLNAYPRM